MPPRFLCFISCGLLLSCCSLAAQNHSAAPPLPQFVDVAPQVGLTVSHLASKEQHYIVESMSGGVGLFDWDHDDRLDVVVTKMDTVEVKWPSGQTELLHDVAADFIYNNHRGEWNQGSSANAASA